MPRLRHYVEGILELQVKPQFFLRVRVVRGEVGVRVRYDVNTGSHVIDFLCAEAEHFTLVAGKTPPQPQGKAIYVRSSGTLVFLASNMPAVPAQKAYELWLIPQTGAPIPAGLFKPDAHGAATLIRPPLPAGVEAKAFAITVEPDTGSSAPTSQPIMVGTAG